MKTVIIYDSVYGNTGAIAEAIAAALGSEASLIQVAKATVEDIASADLVIIGTPTHAGRVSEAVKNFLTQVPAEVYFDKHIAVFSTGIPSEGMNFFLRLIIKTLGYAAVPTMAVLAKKRAIVAGEPINLLVKGKEGPLLPGEIERAVAWARSIVI